MHLSDLQDKDIINVIDGKNIGNIIDVVVKEDGSMDDLIVLKKSFFFNFFKSKEEYHISWNQIEKIGEDVILVRLS